MSEADCNIQYFDNKLAKILAGGPDYSMEAKYNESFLDGACSVSVIPHSDCPNVHLWFCRSDTNESIETTIGTTAYSEPYVKAKIIKCTERAGCFFYTPMRPETDTAASNSWCGQIGSFCFDENDSLSFDYTSTFYPYGTCTQSAYSISFYANEVDNVLFTRSINNSGFFLYWASASQAEEDASIAAGQNFWIVRTLSQITCPSINTKIPISSAANKLTPTNSSSADNTTDLSYASTPHPDPYPCSANHAYWGFIKAYTPSLSFENDDVIIAKGDSPRTMPFIFQRHKYSYGNRNKATIITCIAGGTTLPQTVLKDYDGNLTEYPWLEDDGYVILGVYPAKQNRYFAITYKPGTYSAATWLDDAFDVWNISLATPNFAKTQLKLADIVSDILI